MEMILNKEITINHYHRYTILHYLEQNHSATINQLADLCGLSLPTTRKYLKFLDEENLLSFKRGLAQKVNHNVFHMLDYKTTDNRVAKEKIASKAATFIGDNQTIFLGGGSTVLYMVPHLQDKKNLTVITNSVHLFSQLSSFRTINLIHTGGHYKADTFTFVGNIEAICKKFNIQKAFVGLSGIDSERGVCQGRSLMEQDEDVIVDYISDCYFLADNSKFNQPYPWVAVPVTKIKQIITNKKLSHSEKAIWQGYGTNIIEV